VTGLADTRLAEAGIFEGYASLFGVPDLKGDAVAPGAFAASLARRRASGVRLLWQHDPAEPVGAWLDLAEDSRGLRARGRLNLGVGRARELLALCAKGRWTGSRSASAPSGRAARRAG